MSSVVLADTGPLYPLRDPNDSWHERSRAEVGRLRAERLKVLVSYSTLIEGHTLALRKLGITEAQSFLMYVARTAILVNPTVEDYDRATVRVLRYSDQDITLADTVLAEVGHRLEAPVWTYESERQGIKRKPGKRKAANDEARGRLI